MDDLPVRSARIDVRKIQPRMGRMDSAIERKGVTRRVPALVVIFPPMLNPQHFQHYLVKTAPRIFAASSGVSPSGRRYAHEPAGSYYLREAFHRALTEVTAAQLPRAISILPILMASCAARGEQLVARAKITRDNLVPIHARAFDMMMSVDTDALYERMREAEAEQIDMRTNWNYQDSESLPASDQRRRRQDQQRYNERDDFIRMARTLLGEDNAESPAPSGPVRVAAMGERCHDRAWSGREMHESGDGLPPGRVEVLLGSSEIDGRILSEFDMTFDADGESQLLCAYDSMRQVELASATSILDPNETVYLMVSVAPRFYEAEFGRIMQQFGGALPIEADARTSSAMADAFSLVMNRVTRMMAVHSRFVQSFIENPQDRRIVVFNTDEYTPFIDLVGIPPYDPFARAMSPPERLLGRYFPLLMNACSEQLLEALNSDVSALRDIRIPHVFVNEDTMTRVQVARMGGALTTLITATYAPPSEMQTLDPAVVMQLRTAEGDTGRLPVPVALGHSLGTSAKGKETLTSPSLSDDEDDGRRTGYEEIGNGDPLGSFGALLLIESRSNSPPLSDSDSGYDSDRSMPALGTRPISPPVKIRAASLAALPSSDTFYVPMPTGSVGAHS
jgi:hypothetical protein